MDLAKQLNEISSSSADEENIIQLIKQKVDEMLQSDAELLMSYLYRLDVSEYKIQQALKGEDVSNGIARLIWSRQKARFQTKKDIKVKKLDEDDELGWSNPL